MIILLVWIVCIIGVVCPPLGLLFMLIFIFSQQ